MNKTIAAGLALVSVLSVVSTASFAAERAQDQRLERSSTYMGTTGKQITNNWKDNNADCNGVADCRGEGQNLKKVNSFTSDKTNEVLPYPKEGYVLDSAKGGYVYAPGAARHR